MLLFLFALWQQDSLAARAESLLAAGDLAAARRLAEQLVAQAPRDPNAHLLLGRVWLAWPVVGRYQALDEFRTAARLAPGDPAPLYQQILVGEYLGSDDGEVMVRTAILRIFRLDPDYADCWTRFEHLYHSTDIWRQADEALAAHPDDLSSLEHRAQIAIALDEPARADSLALRLLARRPHYVPAFLIEAEANFDAGRDPAGYAWYDSALVNADNDSTGALWGQVWMIASPMEIARHDSATPAGQRRFFEWFWSRRDPDLVTPENERIAEHFRRLAEVRRMFHLLHPYVRFQRSPTYRALAESYENDTIRALAKNGKLFDTFSPASAIGADLRDYSDTVGALTVYALANLNARGMIWLRHGRPDYWDREQGTFYATHAWTYYTPEGPLTISFEGIPGANGAHGDDIVAPPANRHLARQVRTLLTTDQTSLRATLAMRGWAAFFRSDALGFTDLYLATTAPRAAAVLRDTLFEQRDAAASGGGVLRLSIPPGVYDLALDGDSAGRLGRMREAIRVPAYSEAVLGVSSLTLAPGDSLADRGTALATMPPDLRYAAGRPLATYAEVYGVSRAPDDRARYRVRYTFRPLRSAVARFLGRDDPVVVEFTRDAPWRGVLPERIVIEPGRLPPGRYRVTLAVTDVLSNVKSETVGLDVDVR
jgi:tetratricopeptide (TPR) repeat protein